MIDCSQLRAVLMLLIWGVAWNVAWNWLSRPSHVTRIELPSTAALLSVSDSGLASVTMDATAGYTLQRSFAKVWDMKTGLEHPLPYRPGDKFLGYGLSYQYPCFVFRDGCVHLIDPVTGETAQRYEELRSASYVQASPDRLRLLVQTTPTSFDLFDISTRKVLWSYTPPAPPRIRWASNDFVSAMDFTTNSSVLIDASTGRQTRFPTLDTPYLMTMLNGKLIAVDRFASLGLCVKEYSTNKLLATLNYRDRQLDSSNRDQIRFSADRKSVLIDYVDQSGKVATFEWDMTNKTLDERYTLAPFTVAANGSVLETHMIESLKWWGQLWRDSRRALGLPPEGQIQSSVYAPSGRLLLRRLSTFRPLNTLEETAQLTDGGQGLVVYNNNGLEYYRVPPHAPSPLPYWLGLLAPPVVVGSLWRWRRAISQPVTTTV